MKTIWDLWEFTEIRGVSECYSLHCPSTWCKWDLSPNALSNLQGHHSVTLVTLARICYNLSNLAFQDVPRITNSWKSQPTPAPGPASCPFRAHLAPHITTSDPLSLQIHLTNTAYTEASPTQRLSVKFRRGNCFI